MGFLTVVYKGRLLYQFTVEKGNYPANQGELITQYEIPYQSVRDFMLNKYKKLRLVPAKHPVLPDKTAGKHSHIINCRIIATS